MKAKVTVQNVTERAVTATFQGSVKYYEEPGSRPFKSKKDRSTDGSHEERSPKIRDLESKCDRKEQ